MEAAGRGGIPREEVANRVSLVCPFQPRRGLLQVVGAPLQLPFEKTIDASHRLSVQRLRRPLQEASDRITPGGAGGVAERDGHSIAMKEGSAY